MVMARQLAFTIRTAVAADTSGILECLRIAFEPYRALYTPAGFQDTVLTPETIPARMAAMTVFVANDRDRRIIGTVAGGVAAGKHEGHLRGMAVLPEWHGRGVAEQLLSAVEGHFESLGCSRITLDTTQPLQRATHFYLKHGYRSSGNITDFFGMSLYEYAKELRKDT